MNLNVLQGIFPVFKPTGITSSKLLEVIKTKLKSGNKLLTLIGNFLHYLN